jgi:DNA-binding NarL/FixJ family response regulator
VLLSGVEDKQGLHETFACDVDDVILTIQPPEVVLAMIEALHTPATHRSQIARNEAVRGDVRNTSKQKVEVDTQLSAWPDAVTEREREVIRLVREGLSNKEIAD